MQRQVGEHDAVAVRERVHDRLELAVREALGVQQCQRWPGPRLAIGDPRSVGMVVQAQLHVTSPLWESDSQSAGSRTRGFWQDAPSSWTTSASTGLAHLAFVRSPHAHARVRGVRGALLTRGRPGRAPSPAQIHPPPGLTVAPEPHPLLAADEVRYVGQPVAAVVAETRALAEDAAERVEVDYEPLPAV